MPSFLVTKLIGDVKASIPWSVLNVKGFRFKIPA